MGWVRVDDAFYDHHKFIEVGPLGMAQWIAGLAWCNRNLKDGFIPRSKAHSLLDWDGISVLINESDFFANWATMDGEQVSETLVSAGLWEKSSRGYTIHDYHDFQPSAEEVQTRKDDVREARVRAGQQRATTASRTSTGQFLASTNTSTSEDLASKTVSKSAGPASTASTATSTSTSGHPAPNPIPIPLKDSSEQKWTDRGPVSKRAHELAVLAMEQPKTPAGKNGFPKALTIIEAILNAGHSPEDVELTIRHGVDVWSIAAFEFSMQKAKATKPPRSTGDEQPVVRSQRHIALGDVNAYRKSGQTEKADNLQAQIDAGEFD